MRIFRISIVSESVVISIVLTREFLLVISFFAEFLPKFWRIGSNCFFPRVCPYLVLHCSLHGEMLEISDFVSKPGHFRA